MQSEKIIKLLLLFILLSNFTSCKKGDEDPFFSIYTRKKRLVGEWKVSDAEIRYKQPANNAYYEKYKEGKININYSDDNYNYVAEGIYFWNIDIKKNGQYTISKSINVIHYKTLSSVEEGYWYFLDKNKNAGYKNKECITFQPTKYTYNNTVQSEGENENPYFYRIIELKNKEIKLERTYYYDHSQPNNNFNESIDEMITMIPKDQDF